MMSVRVRFGNLYISAHLPLVISFLPSMNIYYAAGTGRKQLIENLMEGCRTNEAQGALPPLATQPALAFILHFSPFS